MSIGDSGRIVIEIEPDVKRALHATLGRNGQTLKNWFVVRVEEYLNDNIQATIFERSEVYSEKQLGTKGKK